MVKIVQLSEGELLHWLKIQLEKRNIRLGRCLEREKVRKVIYEILFYEQGISVKDIECFFIPFGQAGYLSSRQKFELILYAMERDYGNSFLFLGGEEPYCVVTEEDISEIYLQWMKEERLYFSEEDKKEFFVQTLLDSLGLGLLEVLKRVAMEGILIGELCPDGYEKEPAENKIAVCAGGVIIRLSFLVIKQKEEMVRMIKSMLAAENRGELTMMEPVIDFVKEDGTCITAVRPPAGRDWGIRILYSAAKKEESGGKVSRICGV